MNSEKFPMLRFEIEASKLSLLRALDDRNHEVQEMITQSFKGALDQMQMQLDAQVRAALSRVFSEAINEAAEIVRDGLADELASQMAEQVRESVAASMKRK